MDGKNNIIASIVQPILHSSICDGERSSIGNKLFWFFLLFKKLYKVHYI